MPSALERTEGLGKVGDRQLLDVRQLALAIAAREGHATCVPRGLGSLPDLLAYHHALGRAVRRPTSCKQPRCNSWCLESSVLRLAGVDMQTKLRLLSSCVSLMSPQQRDDLAQYLCMRRLKRMRSWR